MADMLVSCSQEDMAAARSLKTALTKRGNQVWMAGDELGPGERWADAISERLHAADVVILLIGKEPDREVRNEWSLALQETWNRKDPVRDDPGGFRRLWAQASFRCSSARASNIASPRPARRSTVS